MNRVPPTSPVRPGRQLFVILSTQRSGSNWLEDRLDSCDAIVMHRAEVFRRTLRDGGYRSYRRSSTTRRLAGAAFPPYAKHRYLGSLVRDPDHAFGFRLMYDQLRRNPSLRVLAFRRRLPVIHLVRENVLATYASSLSAKQSGIFLTRSSEKKSKPVFVPCETLEAELTRRRTQIERHRRRLRGLPAVELSYEGYTKSPEYHDAMLLDFLGLPTDLTMATGLQRQSFGSVRDRIANAADVERVLASTPYSALLSG